MAELSRIARIVDLFSEGETIFLGLDPETREPITVWVNKLNAFETQEAREDGNTRRSERMHWLGQEDAPERQGFMAEIGPLPMEQLADRYAEAYADETYLDVMNDLEVDPEWRERRERIERLPHLLADAGAAEDDPRREELAKEQAAWLEALHEGTLKKAEAKKQEALEMDRDALLAALWERYRQRTTLDVFMQERRTTQLYFALRECDAKDLGTAPGEHRWDHADCDHSQRLCQERAAVRRLPDVLIERAIDVIDGITINPRAAGNLDAPGSSSASSEQPSVAEGSTASTPAETSPERQPS